jgi:SAM-dependent methyltransferase
MFTQAAGYERFMGRWSRRLAQKFATFAQLKDAHRVLDVGCGTGALATAILEQAPNAEVVGIDPSATFVEHARAHAPQAARFEVGDAQHLPFADKSFDAACACLVLNFIPDQRAAVAEMRRVVRDGGTIAAVVWDHANGMTMLKTFWDVADALDPGPRAIEEPQPMLDRDGLEHLWQEQALHGISTEPLAVDMDFASFADYWEPFGLGQGPAGAYLAQLAPHIRDAIARELRHRFIGDTGDRSFSIPARAWAIRGRVGSS